MDSLSMPVSNRRLRRAAALAKHDKKSDPEAFPEAWGEAIIREPECRQVTGLSRSTRWRLERDKKFPRRRQISPGASGWLATEIAAWLEDRRAS
jgi:prophage regulatory protein